MPLVRVLQGHDGPIEINEDDRSVTKTYLRPESALAMRAAIRESACASRFQAALAGQHGIRCPRVLALDPGPPARVRFELCSGEVLQSLLLRARLRRERIARLAEAIARGLRIYVGLFGEPYHDLHFNNLLYDAGADKLTFLDFEIPERLRGEQLGAPLEASLANLVGCACYELSRPASLLAPKTCALALINALLAEFAGEVSGERVLQGAHRVFRQLCVPGRSVRGRYYGMIGALIGGRCLARVALS